MSIKKKKEDILEKLVFVLAIQKLDWCYSSVAEAIKEIKKLRKENKKLNKVK